MIYSLEIEFRLPILRAFEECGKQRVPAFKCRLLDLPVHVPRNEVCKSIRDLVCREMTKLEIDAISVRFHRGLKKSGVALKRHFWKGTGIAFTTGLIHGNMSSHVVEGAHVRSRSARNQHSSNFSGNRQARSKGDKDAWEMI